jgi:hypothetical protein
MIDTVSKAVWLSFDEKTSSPLFFVQMHCIMDENKTIDYKRTFPQINGQSVESPISRLFGGLFHTQSLTKGGHYKKHFFLKNDLKRRKMVLLSTELT